VLLMLTMLEVMKLAENVASQKVFFSVKNHVENGAYIEDRFIYFKNEKIIAIEEIVLTRCS
jgi:UDP-N-acetylmuramoylalanine--D-glutamate ligase